MTIIFCIIGFIILCGIIKMFMWALSSPADNVVVVEEYRDDGLMSATTGVVAGSIVGAVVAEEIIAHSEPHTTVVYEAAPAVDYVDAEVISGEEEVITEN